jgi:hypothetical protein
MQNIAYFQGEEINGNLFLTCDEVTQCKMFKIVLDGKMRVQAQTEEYVSKSRKSKVTHTQFFTIHQETIELAQETAFDPGTHKIEFKFKVPDDAKVSYEGYGCHIRYEITVNLDVSWRTKVDLVHPIKIIGDLKSISVKEYPQKIARAVALHEGERILEIEIDSPRYCIGDDLAIKYLVDTDMKFSVLRIKIRHVQISRLPGKLDYARSRDLYHKEIKSEDIIRYEWNTRKLKPKKFLNEIPPSIDYPNISTGLFLELEIGRTFRFDKAARIALVAGFCPKIQDISEQDRELLPQNRRRPNRLKCNTCSYSFKLKEEDIDYGTCPTCGKHIFF